MRTQPVANSRLLPILALLFLAAIPASAQRLTNGWYEVQANQLTVRNSVRKLVTGTLLSKNSAQRPDRFYIRLMNPGSKWAWGYAQGEDFKGCGWVSTFRNNHDRSLKRMNMQPSGSPSCSKYETKRPYKVLETEFAAPFPNGTYTNINPRTNGSGANISNPAGAVVYGNYVNNQEMTELTRLPVGRRVCWRFFTKDRRFVMVNFKGTCKAVTGELAAGKWGFVRCNAVKPDPRDKKDKEKFEKGKCVLTP